MYRLHYFSGTLAILDLLFIQDNIFIISFIACAFIVLLLSPLYIKLKYSVHFISIYCAPSIPACRRTRPRRTSSVHSAIYNYYFTFMQNSNTGSNKATTEI